MIWQDEYLSPPIKSEKIGFSRIWKFFKKYSILIRHSILPHAPSVEPHKKLPHLKAKGELFAFCERIYQESIERVDKLEKKAFNL